jgi:nucleoid-associated protein YejK
VKGLDYALLRKIREQEKGQHEICDESVPNSNLEKNLNQNLNKSVNIGGRSNVAVKKEGFKDFRTSSVMAETLKNMLHNPDSVLNFSRQSSVSTCM